VRIYYSPTVRRIMIEFTSSIIMAGVDSILDRIGLPEHDVQLKRALVREAISNALEAALSNLTLRSDARAEPDPNKDT
jgi:hypothetical protein